MIMPTSSARVEAGREIGRALGLDPGNTGALRTLMRLLTEVPQQLPPEAQAELDRRWHERRGRTLRSGVGPTLMLLVLIPFIIAMGVRQWGTLLAFSGLVLATAACQWRVASTPRQMIPMFAGLILEMTALAILSSSMGLLGILPGTMAIVTMGYRMYVDRWVHGVAILLTATAALLVPFLLQWYGVIAPMYALRDGAIVLFPTMHDFPPGPTLVYLLVGCVGVVATGLLYGRMYLGQIRRVERELTFHAWQLEQLIPT